MDGWSDTSRRSGGEVAPNAAPWGFLGMLLLLVGVESLVASRAYDFLIPDDWAYARAGHKIRKNARDYDVFCFGDSLMKLAVVPRVVHERTGFRTYNLALSGSQAPTSYVLLRRALDAGARPAAVLVEFSPALLAVGPEFSRERCGSLFGPIETARLAWWAREPTILGSILAGQVLPSLRARGGLRAFLRGLAAGQVVTNRYATFVSLRNWSINDGAMLWPAAPAMREVSAAKVDQTRRELFSEATCHPANARAIGAFLDLAAARGIRVYWVLPPHWPALLDELERSGVGRLIEGFARSWAERYPNVVVLDGRHAVDDPAGFLDLTHLSDQGAAAFSAAVGDALNRDSREPVVSAEARWRKLPVCRVAPTPTPLENMDGSRLAVQSRSQLSR